MAVVASGAVDADEQLRISAERFADRFVDLAKAALERPAQARKQVMDLVAQVGLGELEPVQEVQILRIAAYVNWRLDELPMALGQLETGLAIARQHGLDEEIPTLLNQKGSVYWAMGDTRQAFGSLERMVEVLSRKGDSEALAIALTNLSLLHFEAGNTQLTSVFLNQAIAMSRRLGMVANQGVLLSYMGRLEMLQGNPQQAVRYFLQGLEINRNLRRSEYIVEDHLLLAEAYLLAGEIPAAKLHVEAARTIAMQFVMPAAYRRSLRMLAQVAEIGRAHV